MEATGCDDGVDVPAFIDLRKVRLGECREDSRSGVKHAIAAAGEKIASCAGDRRRIEAPTERGADGRDRAQARPHRLGEYLQEGVRVIPIGSQPYLSFQIQRPVALLSAVRFPNRQAVGGWQLDDIL